MQHGDSLEVPTCRSASVSPNTRNKKLPNRANDGFMKQSKAESTNFADCVYFIHSRRYSEECVVNRKNARACPLKINREIRAASLNVRGLNKIQNGS